ncbi:MAG TPA: CHC2 zinc finger domain-containing protein, partial [Leptolyngbyaceae cyanobacterium]
MPPCNLMVYAPTKRIHADTIEEVKQRADIVEVISEHLVLNKRGKDYMGLCPFHDEKTPSFSVSPTKQLYYCFGCNVGGNAIKFLMELNKYSFTEVVMELAQRYNVPAKLEDGSIAPNKILTPLHKKPLPQTPAIPPGALHLVKLSAPATDIPQQEKSHDPKRGEVFKTTYVYSLTESGEPQHWVIRTEWKDSSKPKGRDKKFTQSRRASKGEIIPIWENGKKTDKTKVATEGETVWDKGKEPWSAYRIEEAIRAAKNTSGIPVLVVPEGEKGVELLRSVGVAAFNPQGWAEDEIRLALLRYKKECASGIVAVLRDNDEAGTTKANKFQEIGHSVTVPVIIIDPVAIYPDLPEKGDVEEILTAMETPEFIRRLEAEIHEAVAARHGSSGSSSGGDSGDEDGSDWLRQRTERDRKGEIARHPTFEPLSIKEIEARIEEFIKQGLTGSKLTSQLNRLSAESQWRVTELRKLYQERKAEDEQSEERAEAKLSLPSLLQNRTLNLTDYLWGDNGVLAQAISGTAKAMPTSSEFLFTTLLPTAAALIGTSSRIVVKAKGKYKQPCIIWSAVVARSGQLKTPAQNVILDPLVKLEIEESQKYQTQLEQYEINLANWKKNKNAKAEDKPKPPSRKRYLTKDATIESLERIHSENPRGVLVHRDEIAEDFKADNAYRNGKGGDKEKKLDQFNGSPLIIDRKEREIALERSAISRTGSIQWEV